ncbi:MAG: VRR-NUC domain-containing protein [Clostridia bacterium]|nr:VRR-NUC domain-containing protein [Clostridia bacterium]
MKPKESEKTLEARLVREIEARGGMALKYTSQFHRGIPDRICLIPPGILTFIELKSTGQKPTKLQEHAMEKLTSLGFDCLVIDTTEKLEEYLGHVDQTIEKLPQIAEMRMEMIYKMGTICNALRKI